METGIEEAEVVLVAVRDGSLFELDQSPRVSAESLVTSGKVMIHSQKTRIELGRCRSKVFRDVGIG
jgi:hypothetical protein